MPPTSVSSMLDVRPALQNDRMFRSGYEDFRGQGLFFLGDGHGAASTTAANILLTDRNVFEYQGVGTMDSAYPVLNEVDGLLLTAAMTSNNVGLELRPSISAASRGRGTFTVGTDDPFYVSVKFKLHDVSGTDVCMVGFRKAEAHQASADGQASYTNLASLDVKSGTIEAYTILASATAVETSTTQSWVDDGVHKLTVLVDKKGNVTYEIDDAPPTVSPTTTYTFTNGTVVIPFFRIQNDSDVADATSLQIYAWGYQGDSVAPRTSGRVTIGN